MHRRSLLKASVALAAFTGIAQSTFFSAQALAAEPADGELEHFDFDSLKALAKDLASKPYKDRKQVLPPTLANLEPLNFNAIRYDAGHSLWNENPGRQIDAQFFHVGMGFKTPVRMYSVDAKSKQAREIHFRPSLFNYRDSGVDESQLKGKSDLGFAGFRLFKAPELTRNDIVSFLGASYFRAIDKNRQYGLSARGLAVNTYAGGPEEFPDFTRFWFEAPSTPNGTRCVVYALLESPSAAGAYRFDIDCQAEQVVMDVQMQVTARTAIKQLGITPMTSMFSCGTHQRRMCDTIHPEIHDSDRLAMWRGNGEWICRPLNNPLRIQFNTFEDKDPKGFGLVQTDRRFETYEDTIDQYDKRPSLWVEPTTAWGEGSVDMMEMPTTGETLDNIVVFWSPKAPVKAGDTLGFGYKLYWAPLPPVSTPLAQVRATRSGMGGFREGWAPGEHYPEVWARRFAVDFVGAGIDRLPKKALNNNLTTIPEIEPVFTATNGTLKDFVIIDLPQVKGVRVLFDWYPTNDSVEPVNIRGFIRSGQRTLSETWLYQYFPPAPDKRKYVYE